MLAAFAKRSSEVSSAYTPWFPSQFSFRFETDVDSNFEGAVQVEVEEGISKGWTDVACKFEFLDQGAVPVEVEEGMSKGWTDVDCKCEFLDQGSVQVEVEEGTSKEWTDIDCKFEFLDQGAVQVEVEEGTSKGWTDVDCKCEFLDQGAVQVEVGTSKGRFCQAQTVLLLSLSRRATLIWYSSSSVELGTGISEKRCSHSLGSYIGPLPGKTTPFFSHSCFTSLFVLVGLNFEVFSNSKRSCSLIKSWKFVCASGTFPPHTFSIFLASLFSSIQFIISRSFTIEIYFFLLLFIKSECINCEKVLFELLMFSCKLSNSSWSFFRVFLNACNSDLASFICFFSSGCFFNSPHKRAEAHTSLGQRGLVCPSRRWHFEHAGRVESIAFAVNDSSKACTSLTFVKILFSWRCSSCRLDCKSLSIGDTYNCPRSPGISSSSSSSSKFGILSSGILWSNKFSLLPSRSLRRCSFIHVSSCRDLRTGVLAVKFLLTALSFFSFPANIPPAGDWKAIAWMVNSLCFTSRSLICISKYTGDKSTSRFPSRTENCSGAFALARWGTSFIILSLKE